MNSDILFTLIWCFAGIIMLIYYTRRKHPLLSAMFGMITGGGSLVLINMYGEKIGIFTEMNFFNTMMSLVLGIPGTVMLILTEQFL